jgi:hypothetical protein
MSSSDDGGDEEEGYDRCGQLLLGTVREMATAVFGRGATNREATRLRMTILRAIEVYGRGTTNRMIIHGMPLGSMDYIDRMVEAFHHTEEYNANRRAHNWSLLTREEVMQFRRQTAVDTDSDSTDELGGAWIPPPPVPAAEQDSSDSSHRNSDDEGFDQSAYDATGSEPSDDDDDQDEEEDEEERAEPPSENEEPMERADAACHEIAQLPFAERARARDESDLHGYEELLNYKQHAAALDLANGRSARQINMQISAYLFGQADMPVEQVADELDLTPAQLDHIAGNITGNAKWSTVKTTFAMEPLREPHEPEAAFGREIHEKAPGWQQRAFACSLRAHFLHGASYMDPIMLRHSALATPPWRPRLGCQRDMVTSLFAHVLRALISAEPGPLIASDPDLLPVPNGAVGAADQHERLFACLNFRLIELTRTLLTQGRLDTIFQLIGDWIGWQPKEVECQIVRCMSDCGVRGPVVTPTMDDFGAVAQRLAELSQIQLDDGEIPPTIRRLYDLLERFDNAAESGPQQGRIRWTPVVHEEVI